MLTPKSITVRINSGLIQDVIKYSVCLQIEETLKEKYKLLIPLSAQEESVKQQIEDIQKEVNLFLIYCTSWMLLWIKYLFGVQIGVAQW